MTCDMMYTALLYLMCIRDKERKKRRADGIVSRSFSLDAAFEGKTTETPGGPDRGMRDHARPVVLSSFTTHLSFRPCSISLLWPCLANLFFPFSFRLSFFFFFSLFLPPRFLNQPPSLLSLLSPLSSINRRRRASSIDRLCYVLYQRYIPLASLALVCVFPLGDSTYTTFRQLTLMSSIDIRFFFFFGRDMETLVVKKRVL